MYKSVTLQCSAININKNVTSLNYQWQKESVDIKNAQSRTYTTNIPGSYRCKISNGYTTVYTQDAVLSKEPIWVTGIVINTTEITNTGKIDYTVLPENADNKTVTFDEVTTSDYSINSEGIVNIKNNCNFEVVIRSQFGKDYSEVIGKGNIVGTVIIPISLIAIITNTICDAGQIETYTLPINADIIKKQFDIISGFEYVEMDETGYVYEVHTPGVINVSVSGFDKLNNVVCSSKNINCVNKYTRLDNVTITSDTVYKNNFIEYVTTPFTTTDDISSIKFEVISGNDIVSVDDNTGKVINVTKTGECTVKLTIVDNYGTTLITQKSLNCVILVESIIIDETTIHNSGKVSYRALPQNASNKTIKFEFKTTTDVANISEDGFVTVMKNGNNVLVDDVIRVGDIVVVGKAQDGSGVTGENTIHLTKTPDTIYIYISSIDFVPTTITDEGIISVTYSPLNATVSEFNKIDPSKLFIIEGDNTTYTLTHNESIHNNGVLDTYKVVVLKQTTECIGVASVNINNKSIIAQHQLTLIKTIPVTSITVKEQTITDSGTVTYTVNPSNATNKTVKFELASTSNATIDSSTGKLTVKNNGSVKVIIKAQDGSGVTGEATITLIKTQRIINPSVYSVIVCQNHYGNGLTINGVQTKTSNSSKLVFDWNTTASGSTFDYYVKRDGNVYCCRRLCIRPNNITWSNTNYTSLSGKGTIIIPNFYTWGSTYAPSGKYGDVKWDGDDFHSYGIYGHMEAIWCLDTVGKSQDNKTSQRVTYTTADGYSNTIPVYIYDIVGDDSTYPGNVCKTVKFDFDFNYTNIQQFKQLKFVLSYSGSVMGKYAPHNFRYTSTSPIEITMENCEYVLY